MSAAGPETYETRKLCYFATREAARQAKCARKNNEKWCKARPDGTQVCRSPVAEDFYTTPASMPIARIGCPE